MRRLQPKRPRLGLHASWYVDPSLTRNHISSSPYIFHTQDWYKPDNYDSGGVYYMLNLPYHGGEDLIGRIETALRDLDYKITGHIDPESQGQGPVTIFVSKTIRSNGRKINLLVKYNRADHHAVAIHVEKPTPFDCYEQAAFLMLRLTERGTMTSFYPPADL